MKIIVTNAFLKTSKKLHRNQIKIVEEVIDEISRNPELGELKTGDLAGVRVYKFRILHQLILLAYLYEKNKSEAEVTLLSLSSHENFYRDLKKNH